MDDFTPKPPIPPDLGKGILVTFDICKATQHYRANIHDGNAKETFSCTDVRSYGEALAKAVMKRRLELGLSVNNMTNKLSTRRQASN